MNLDEAQKKKVTDWIAQGLKLSEIQKNLAAELGAHMTYMEVRLLVDDLKLVPKDTEPSKPVELPGKQTAVGSNPPAEEVEPGDEVEEIPPEEKAASTPDGVSIRVDELARPGALVSGSVTFSDGKSAAWYLDEFGRLGLAPKQQGYKPSATDLQVFQTELQNELAKLGF